MRSSMSMATSSLSIAAETMTALAPSALALANTARRMGVAVRRLVLVDVADVEHRLGGEQLRLREQPRFLLVLGLGQPRRLAFAQQLERLAEDARGDLRFLVALLAALDEVGDALLEAFEVGEQQLGLDHLGVGDRVRP